MKLEPPEVVLSDISSSEGSEVEVWLYAFGVSDLDVRGVRFSNSDLAPYFDIQFTRAEAPEDRSPAPELALRGTLVAKPGLPLGSINQTIHLETDDAEVPEIDLRVTGRVSSDISVVGPSSYRSQLNVLILGQVESEAGAETTLRVLVKGPHRHETSLEIGEVETNHPDAKSVPIHVRFAVR